MGRRRDLDFVWVISFVIAIISSVSYGADIFFDDQQVHCDSAREHVATGHVPNGIRNLRDV